MNHARLSEDLSLDKKYLIAKYRLVPKQINNKLYWVREFQNRPDHPYGSHRAFRNCHILELVFSVYDLCVAKMTYFKNNIQDYTPCKMDYRNRTLQPCALWDMEFLVQKSTGIPIDLRNLAEIREIEVFRSMCRWLEGQLRQSREAEGEGRQIRLVV
ncbi:MAG: hypothetical protein C0622_08675 [Desulfuromonas sp.]|nr:MAG: hypothetical protein C0622_08675 [Desulfuromonas sp.]